MYDECCALQQSALGILRIPLPAVEEYTGPGTYAPGTYAPASTVEELGTGKPDGESSVTAGELKHLVACPSCTYLLWLSLPYINRLCPLQDF